MPPLTPAAGSAPYCTPAEFLDFVDANLAGQLLRDDGVQLTVAAMAAEPRLAAHLGYASGEVETACTRGGRYAPADLLALAGNGRALLAKLVSDLALGSLMARRGYPLASMPPGVADARALLDRLADGEAVLPFAEIEAAGLPVARPKTPAEVARSRLAGDSYATARFTGRASSWGPAGPGEGYGPGYGR